MINGLQSKIGKIDAIFDYFSLLVGKIFYISFDQDR